MPWYTTNFSKLKLKENVEMSKENWGIELGLKLQRFTRHEVLIINHVSQRLLNLKGITGTLRKFLLSEFGEHIATFLTTWY